MTSLAAANGGDDVTSKSRLALKHAGMQLVAGGSAGCVEVSLMHPLDLVKTRFQLQATPPVGGGGGGAQQHYTGVADCMRKMYRTEGVLSFWKGILPPILVETPKRAWKFLTFEQFKAVFNFNGRDAQPTPLTYSLAGLGSGVTEAILVNPFEAIKVRMQSDRAHQSHAPSTMSVAKQMIRSEGLVGGILCKGLTATMGRNGFFNMWYFGFYHSVKDIVPSPQDPTLDLLRRLTIGFLAGTFASMFNIPFDVAKSRIQGPQPTPGVVKYRGTVKTIALVYKEEGALALYKGLLPKIMRLGPGGAIMMIVYENVYGFLKNKYPD